MSAETWAERKRQNPRDWEALYQGKPQPYEWEIVRTAAESLAISDPILAALLRSVAEEWRQVANFRGASSMRGMPREILRKNQPIWHDALVLAEQILNGDR